MSDCVDPRECEDCGKHLYEYQHHELDAAAALKIKEHLGSCQSCLALWQEEEAIRKRLQQCACERAPEQLRMQVTTLIATFRRTIG
jgi:anti-sigma factor (TIGR02949 family)